MRLCDPFFAYFSRPKIGAGRGGVDFIDFEKAMRTCLTNLDIQLFK